MGTDKIELNKFKNIIIDPQVEKNYFETQTVNTKFQPEIGYYNSLLKNSKFAVGANINDYRECVFIKII